MSINAYIDSLGTVDKTKIVSSTWSKVETKTKSRPLCGKGEIPFQFEVKQKDEKTLTQRKKAPYSEEKKVNSYETHHDSIAKYGNHRLADIIPSVREIGGGYNTFSNDAIERRFRENQSKYASTEESDSTTYATISSKSADDSFNTAFSSLKLSSDESKNEISSIDEQRYKKNALVAGLLHTQNIESLDIDTSNDTLSDVYNTSLDKEDKEENWDDDESDEELYKGRIIRFFQSAEDEDVYVHPLKEQIQKDPEWQKYQLRRKGVEVIQTPRQFYLELEDEDFTFEPKKST